MPFLAALSLPSFSSWILPCWKVACLYVPSRHEVTVKVASDDAGEVFDASAEYDEAEAVARATDLPVREVVRRAEAAWRETR